MPANTHPNQTDRTPAAPGTNPAHPAPTLARTPPMGWNSWNMWGWQINEEKVLKSADALVQSGLRDLGYNYLVVDDCWSVKEGRDAKGNLVPDPVKFPNGIKPLVDHAHSLGLKFGIYSDAAERTCGGHPGSLGHERQDAELWASWGVDFLKYDYCAAPNEQDVAIARYTAMGRALQATGREFLFSLCEWGGRSPWIWGRQAGGSMWRVTGDIFDSWTDVWNDQGNGNGWWGLGIDRAIDVAAFLSDCGGPGGWNDLDMLIVGLKGKGQIHGTGLSFNEYQTHMSVWVMACSPLMIGCDITNMDEDTRKLLTNQEVLAVNQDPLGIPARRVRQYGSVEIWKKPLADGNVACMVINRGTKGEQVSIKAGDIGLLDEPKIARNLWTGEDSPDFGWDMNVRILPHQTLLYRVER